MEQKHTLINPTLRGRIRVSRQHDVNGRALSLQTPANTEDAHKPGLAASAANFNPVADIRRAVPKVQAHHGTGIATVNLMPKVAKAQHINNRIAGVGQDIIRPVKIQPHLPKQQRTAVLKRHVIRPPNRPSSLRRRRMSKPVFIIGLSIFLFVSGIAVVLITFRSNHTAKAEVNGISQDVAGANNGIANDVPSELEPSNILATYKVSDNLPRILTIDKIGVSAKVHSLGSGPNGLPNAPSNIFDVGWYDGSAKPGEKGTVVLVGHVSGPTKQGVFHSIGTLKAGDKVKLERGDGREYTYTVTGTQTSDNDKVDKAKVLTSSIVGKPGLNFMTSSGRFNVRSNQFEQRTIVFTIQDE